MTRTFSVEIGDEEVEPQGRLVVLGHEPLLANIHLLHLGNFFDGESSATAVTNQAPKQFGQRLDAAFTRYIKDCCEDLPCKGAIKYLKADGTLIAHKETYGQRDAAVSLVLEVYCSIPESGYRDWMDAFFARNVGQRFVVVTQDSIQGVNIVSAGC